jgi:ABC-type polysaccharide/polyol phosphate export permease
MLRDRAFIADFNQLFHFIQILRAPLLGQAAPLTSWAVVLAVTLVGWGVTLTFASRWIKRVPYWL